MKPILFVVGLLAASVLTASAQDAKPLAPRAIREAVLVPAPYEQPKAPPAKLFFCPSKTCLYYAGDPDSASPNYNSLIDTDNPGIGITDAEVWVGVKPTSNATIIGTSGNFGGLTVVGTNPTPFAVQKGIKPGHGGTMVCQTSGNAVFQSYESWGNIYIKKLSNPCHLKAKTIYYVHMTLQYNDGFTIGYLIDDDGKHANKRGWPEIKDKSYFNSTSFGVDYQPTWGSKGACGGIGCSGFSISMTGTQH